MPNPRRQRSLWARIKLFILKIDDPTQSHLAIFKERKQKNFIRIYRDKKDIIEMMSFGYIFPNPLQDYPELLTLFAKICAPPLFLELDKNTIGVIRCQGFF